MDHLSDGAGMPLRRPQCYRIGMTIPAESSMKKQRKQPSHAICEPSKVEETIARMARLFKVRKPAFYVVHHDDGTNMPHVHIVPSHRR
ncbi:hypothetical protein ASE07_23650 [Noviherbaspirillum sp. Root189]|nr:hypothetical protein ASE07_23650 [Noviherbaspirillum sp. Root189]